MKKIKKYSEWIIPFLLVLALILVYKSLDNFNNIAQWFSYILGILRPFIMGFLIAFIFNLPCKKIEILLKKTKSKFLTKRSKGLSILIVYLLAICAIVFVVRALFPAIYKNLLDLYNNIPTYITQITEFITTIQERFNVQLIQPDGEIMVNKIVEEFFTKFDINEFSKYAQGVLDLTSGLINIIISLIVSVYMLLDKELFTTQIKKLINVFFEKKRAQHICNYMSKINNIFSKYIYCRVIDGTIMAIISTIILNIIGVKYALILGITIGVCNLIPYFGAMIGAVITVIVTLLTGNIFQTLWTAAALLVMEQIDGNYIGPKIMGEVLEIRPIWVIFAVTVGGGLFGFFGMLFSVPVIVAIKMSFDDYVAIKQEKKLEREQMLKDTKDM